MLYFRSASLQAKDSEAKALCITLDTTENSRDFLIKKALICFAVLYGNNCLPCNNSYPLQHLDLNLT
jgi:hypothetical protein